MAGQRSSGTSSWLTGIMWDSVQWQPSPCLSLVMVMCSLMKTIMPASTILGWQVSNMIKSLLFGGAIMVLYTNDRLFSCRTFNLIVDNIIYL